MLSAEQQAFKKTIQKLVRRVDAALQIIVVGPCQHVADAAVGGVQHRGAVQHPFFLGDVVRAAPRRGQGRR